MSMMRLASSRSCWEAIAEPGPPPAGRDDACPPTGDVEIE